MIVYTIGHSTNSLDQLIRTLRRHEISAVGDVRSQPYSRVNPQFNRETLKEALNEAGIAYVFLGRELGARSDDPDCYEHGKVSYERLAKTSLFQQGLERAVKGASEYRLALMCAEKEPLDCHRTILVARHLTERGIEVLHILSDGSVEEHRDTLRRLKATLKLGEDMFKSEDDVIREAYEIQGARIAYAPQTPATAAQGSARGAE